MTTYTLIANSTSIKRDDGTIIPANTLNRDYNAYLAWLAVGNTPNPAPTPAVMVPQSVTNAQARAVLLATPSINNPGKTLFDDAVAAVTAAGGDANVGWEYANDITRNGALVQSIGPTLGLTDAQIDQLFIQASAINF